MKNSVPDGKNVEALVDVVPIDVKGERGLVHIMAASKAEQWIQDNAAKLLASGYNKAIIEPHRFGGNQWKWFRENDAVRIREEMRKR